MMQTRRPGRLLFLAFAIQIALKLWLVHRHEIVACDYPFDDPWYVTASTNWYWWGTYADGAFIRPPAYPLWIALSRSMGLPLRLSTEFLLLAAAGALALSLLRAGLPRVAATLVFGLIIFHPFSVVVNDYAMADSLYGPMLLLSIAGMIALLARRGRRSLAMWTGLSLVVLWYTRQESPLIILYIGLFALVAAWVRAGEGGNPRAIVRDVGGIVLLMAFVVGGGTFVVRTMNYVAFGAFADHELVMPGCLDAYGALLSIIPEQPVHWVPVTHESLRRAYAVSPAARQLQPYFESPESRRWAPFGRQNVTNENEIGQLAWALRIAIRSAGHGSSAAEADTFCAQIAEEIDTACTGGQLRCTYPLLGPLRLLRSHLSEVPASLRTVGRLLFWHGEAFQPRCAATAPSTAVVDVFDVAANRRTALVTAALDVTGWVVDFADPPRAVSFRDPQGRVVAFTDRLRARPDLDDAFRARLAAHPEPLLAAFDLSIPLPLDRDAGGALIVTLRSGREVAIEYGALRSMDLKHPFTAGDDGSVEYAIELRQTVHPEGQQMDARAVSHLLGSYHTGVLALSVAGLAALLILVPVRLRQAGDRVLYGAGLLLLGITASRVALFAVYDAIVWPGNDPRFLYPVAHLYPCAMVVLVCCAVRGVAARSAKSTTRPARHHSTKNLIDKPNRPRDEGL